MQIPSSGNNLITKWDWSIFSSIALSKSWAWEFIYFLSSRGFQRYFARIVNYCTLFGTHIDLDFKDDFDKIAIRPNESSTVKGKQAHTATC